MSKLTKFSKLLIFLIILANIFLFINPNISIYIYKNISVVILCILFVGIIYGFLKTSKIIN